MEKTDIRVIKAYMLERLQRALPRHLSYHSAQHTLDVYEACERIALAERLEEPALTLLLTAALFHDSGFIVSDEDHEEKSCAIAFEELPKFGYDEQDIQTICSMIRATRIPQSPSTLPEKIICDADLDYLGRDDFETIGNKLFNELKHSAVVDSIEEWDRVQIKFLEQHHYFTQTAIQTRAFKKDQHLSALKNKYKPDEQQLV